jgi:hypothetical protein
MRKKTFALDVAAAQAAVDEWVDAIELWAEDQDEDAAEYVTECTRFLFDDVPALALVAALRIVEAA